MKKKLGEGRYGRVYQSGSKHEPIALKVNTVQTPVSFLSTIREIDLLGHMSFSPRIIKLNGLIPHNRSFRLERGYRIDTTGLSFELAECDLQQYIDGDTKYSRVPERNDRYLRELLHGLAELHRMGFLHRDIKPDNVLIVKDQVKYCDFGLAKQVMKKMTPRLTAPVYRAPEIFLNQPYDGRADVWSLGCMFIELLCQRSPDSEFYKTEKATWLSWIKTSKWRPLIEEMLAEKEKRPTAEYLLKRYFKVSVELPAPVNIVDPPTEFDTHIEPFMEEFNKQTARYKLKEIHRNTVHLIRQYYDYCLLHGEKGKKRGLGKGATAVTWHPENNFARASYDRRWRYHLCHYLAVKYFHEEADVPSFSSFTNNEFRELPMIADFERFFVSIVLNHRIWTNHTILPY